MEFNRLSVTEIIELYSKGEATPSEVLDECLDAIGNNDNKIGAFLEVYYDKARERALELDKEYDPELPLYGVPVAIKDNICTKLGDTTCASRILKGYRPPYDATVIKRLLAAGAVIIGKTNLDEFAMGSSTENSAFQLTRNPWNIDFAPGGSSGGSAAAVAGFMVPAALGSDTGGSIRQPASLCGVVGMKGTYGRVSRYGLVAFASSLDQIGPFTRTVADCELIMRVIAGHDEYDATSIPRGLETSGDLLKEGMDGFRVAVPSDTESWDMDERLLKILLDTADTLRERGVEVEEVGLPDMDASIACYYVLANAEASSNLARYDGVKYALRASSDSLQEMYENTRGEGFGEEVKRRVLLGTYVLSSGYYEAYYGKAQKVRDFISRKYSELFESFDLVMLPTTPGPAFRIGERIDDPINMYLSDIFTTPANIAGIPAISVPAGLAGNGLPLGMQLMAGKGMESKLLRGAAELERIYGFNEKYSRRQ